MSDTSARDAIGVALLVRAGVPRLQAELEMAMDPDCQAIADLLTPGFEQFVEQLEPLAAHVAELLTEAGLLTDGEPS